MKHFQKVIFISIFSIILYSCLKMPNKIEQQYPAPWRKPTTTDLVQVAPVLFKNGVGGCSHFYLRKSISSKQEFLIACTDDFVNWTYYLTSTKTEQVLLTTEKINPPSLNGG
jgi:hypothetical protein